MYRATWFRVGRQAEPDSEHPLRGFTCPYVWVLSASKATQTRHRLADLWCGSGHRETSVSSLIEWGQDVSVDKGVDEKNQLKRGVRLLISRTLDSHKVDYGTVGLGDARNSMWKSVTTTVRVR